MYQDQGEYQIPGPLSLTQEPHCCIVSEMGILYTTSQIPLSSSNQIVLDGQCRVQFSNGIVLEGQFNNGVSVGEVNYIERYPRGWMRGPWKDNGMNGIIQVYNKNGYLEYEGEMKNGVRDGCGEEYLGDDIFEGTWKNNLKQGKFKEKLRNFSITAQGNYQKGEKVGEWVFSNSQTSQTITYSSTPSPNLNQRSPCYNMNLTQSDYEKLINFGQMLSHDLVSAWAYYLQSCLLLKCKNDILLFPTQIIKDFKGINHNQCKYSNVRLITKHFQGKFHICWMMEDGQKKLIFPIIRGGHFYLVVVKIIRTNGDYQFYGLVYDSLSGSKQEGECVKQYILAEINDKCQQSSKQYFLTKINNMKFEVMPCAQQSDSISCGAFVSLFMERFVQQEQIEKQVGKKKLQKYRRRMKDLLSQPTPNIQEIFKDIHSKSRIIESSKSIQHLSESKISQFNGQKEQKQEKEQKEEKEQQDVSQPIVQSSDNKDINQRMEVQEYPNSQQKQQPQNHQQQNNFENEQQEPGPGVKMQLQQQVIEKIFQQEKNDAIEVQIQQQSDILATENSVQNTPQENIKQKQNYQENVTPLNKQNTQRHQSQLNQQKPQNEVLMHVEQQFVQNHQIQQQQEKLQSTQIKLQSQSQQQQKLNMKLLDQKEINVTDTHQQIQASVKEKAQSLPIQEQHNVLFFKSHWLKLIHFAILLFVLYLHGNWILQNINLKIPDPIQEIIFERNRINSTSSKPDKIYRAPITKKISKQKNKNKSKNIVEAKRQQIKQQNQQKQQHLKPRVQNSQSKTQKLRQKIKIKSKKEQQQSSNKKQQQKKKKQK